MQLQENGCFLRFPNAYVKIFILGRHTIGLELKIHCRRLCFSASLCNKIEVAGRIVDNASEAVSTGTATEVSITITRLLNDIALTETKAENATYS